jgi:phosphoribosylformylglycinamidine cyclo-ligase
MSKQPSAYRDAGVDIDKKYAAVQSGLGAIRSTYTKGVVGDIGLFGGLFDLDAAGAAGQVLVASTDGVGTKVKIAQMTWSLASVGEDLVNHCVNDILVQGARPLFFLDYIAMAKMQPDSVRQVLEGLAKACRENGCAILGGETAEMPGVYVEGELDVAGTIVGCVERDKLLDGRKIAVGDVAVALVSSGLHTNGYSLARKVLFEELGHNVHDRPDLLQGKSIGEALLAVHKSYLKALWPSLEARRIHGMAHITGGGLPDNTPRVLPEGTAVKIDCDAMPRPPIFDLIAKSKKLTRDEAYRVLNMGFGMVVFVAKSDQAELLRSLEAAGERGHVVGEVVGGNREVILS